MLNLCDLICFEDEKTKDTGRRMSTYQRPPVSGFPMFQGIFLPSRQNFVDKELKFCSFCQLPYL